MLLIEIVNVPPIPYKWTTKNTCVFEYNNNLFGLLIEDPGILTVDYTEIRIGNILFGIIENTDKPYEQSNILDEYLNRNVTQW